MYIPGTTCLAHSSCTSLFILIFIKSTVDCIAHFISLHILLLILFYLFIFLIFILFLPIFIYILLCYVSFFILFFCTVHWADPSWPTFHYWLYPVWLCMWRIIKNLEPWTRYSLHLGEEELRYESRETTVQQNSSNLHKEVKVAWLHQRIRFYITFAFVNTFG